MRSIIGDDFRGAYANPDAGDSRERHTVKRPTEEQLSRWYPRLYRTALRLTGDPSDAADLTQQAFCNALGRMVYCSNLSTDG